MLGGYFSRSNTTVAMAPTGGGTGLAINFEETLDLEERTLTPIGEFSWRINERWRLDIEYFKIGRDATRALASEIQWGDLVFPVGTTVDSSFDFSDTRVSAGYSFFKTPDKEIGVGLGLHVSGIEASITAAGVGAEAADVLAPLPVVNIYGLFALTGEWAMRIRVDWLSLTYDRYTGDVRGIGIDAMYQPFRNVGFGLGIRSLTTDLTIDDPDWRGEARISFQGPTAFVSASF
ncbi:MAG: hypothetical protein L0Z73_09080 [Gammaproteobacteria bacterium]|nr:hypothetical protein [Gammaproteobacteria bacterium]